MPPPKLQASSFHFVDEGDHNTAAGGSHRVAKTDTGAVDVDNLPVQPKKALNGKSRGFKGHTCFERRHSGKFCNFLKTSSWQKMRSPFGGLRIFCRI